MIAKIYKSKSEVLADWRANKISYRDAVLALIDLGFGLDSFRIVEES